MSEQTENSKKLKSAKNSFLASLAVEVEDISITLFANGQKYPKFIMK